MNTQKDDFSTWLLFHKFDGPPDDITTKFARFVNKQISWQLHFNSLGEILTWIEQRGFTADINFAARVAWEDYQKYLLDGSVDILA